MQRTGEASWLLIQPELTCNFAARILSCEAKLLNENEPKEIATECSKHVHMSGGASSVKVGLC